MVFNSTIPEDAAASHTSDKTTVNPPIHTHVDLSAVTSDDPPTRVRSGGSTRQGVKRTVTSESVLTRITSGLPNPEEELMRLPTDPYPNGGGGGGGGGPPKLQKFSHTFWEPQFKFYRMIAFKILFGAAVMITLVMWLCVPLYFGSLWKANHYTDKLTVRIIDRDGGAIGQAVTQALLTQKNLRYFVTSPSEFPTIEAIETDIVEEGAWASVVINEGASTAVEIARATGDAAYNGTQAISVIYAQARSETAIGSYLIPILQATLGAVTTKLSAESVATFLQQNAGNATAIQTAASAPLSIVSPISFALVNVRPFNQPVATAITLVGMIYLLIFSFVITMANNGAREIIAPYLTTRSYLIYRIVAPLSIYGWLSLSFAMISLPFKVEFGAHFSYAGGFFLWWVVCWCGMGALGLATEFLITLVGPKFVSFFLVPLIIANVSTVALPHELQPWIYKYGVAMPFYNCNRAVRTLIFDTKSTFGLNIGILLAWIVFSIITITGLTYWYRCRAVNELEREMGESETEHKLPDGRMV